MLKYAYIGMHIYSYWSRNRSQSRDGGAQYWGLAEIILFILKVQKVHKIVLE